MNLPMDRTDRSTVKTFAGYLQPREPSSWVPLRSVWLLLEVIMWVTWWQSGQQTLPPVAFLSWRRIWVAGELWYDPKALTQWSQWPQRRPETVWEKRQEKILLKNVNYTFFLFLFSFSLTCLDTVKSYHRDGLGEQVQNFYLMVVGVCHIKQLPLTANADSSRFIKAGFSQFWTQGISGLSGPC